MRKALLVVVLMVVGCGESTTDPGPVELSLEDMAVTWDGARMPSMPLYEREYHVFNNLEDAFPVREVRTRGEVKVTRDGSSSYGEEMWIVLWGDTIQITQPHIGVIRWDHSKFKTFLPDTVYNYIGALDWCLHVDGVELCDTHPGYGGHPDRNPDDFKLWITPSGEYPQYWVLKTASYGSGGVTTGTFEARTKTGSAWTLVPCPPELTMPDGLSEPREMHWGDTVYFCRTPDNPVY